MEPTSTALPDDIDALKALLRERDAQVAELRQQLSSRSLEIEHLKLTIAKLRRMQFGRKSEKLDRQIEQLELRLEDLQADEGAADVAAAPEAKRPRREGPSRKPLPEHLEREERVHLPADDDCPDCGGQLKPLGEDVAEQLEYVRAHFRVIRHRRPKLACARCDRIVQAAAPSRPIDRGIPGPALLAHIAVSKFAYHLPLHRQAVMYARDGVEIDPGAMGYWMGSITALLAPLVDAVRRYTLACGKVHADDTPLPVLAPGNGRTKTGRLWVYVRDDRPSGSDEPPAAWFAYTSDRRGEHPQRHLADFTGVLQADAFAGYAELYLDGRVQEAACMAHARRKIHDLHAVRPNAVTEEALRRIGALYKIEEQIRGKPPDERRSVRQARAVPLLDDMKRWFEATLAKLSAKSDTTKAIRYALNRWPALVYYCSDGCAEIDNLIAERALRAVALGRRNYLFAGADSGGERAAAMYSLIGTARLNGLDPEAYLAYVLERIADYPANRVDELLPWNVAPSLPPTARVEPIR
ncbi:IS66 family transposase [Burkholderia gladioli]|uniref:IS66 family transposase n=3 Tax=Burkholderia gladioli TaxID=28095 RepID=UPI000D00F9D5|nr:IS66 family transposase [Burkholderia gladioli]MBU9173023.1 IS66 family transposase [Burkholderia gladioli]MBU9180423.1 IS66 family transposase [Burkholderia gladioli]MBU9385827.1 IS66 family transposase [Burkholderia gladioli]MDN7807334.1 IS66 family transposase [Burkholderia gladioli]PRG88580.1 IS66 family transposase [Burkholderia gladioli]